jgi:hypothetical protein
MNVCSMVVDGTYEVFEFYVSRASEIGKEALVARCWKPSSSRCTGTRPAARRGGPGTLARSRSSTRKQQQFVDQKASNSSSSSTVLSRA